MALFRLSQSRLPQNQLFQNKLSQIQLSQNQLSQSWVPRETVSPSAVLEPQAESGIDEPGALNQSAQVRTLRQWPLSQILRYSWALGQQAGQPRVLRGGDGPPVDPDVVPPGWPEPAPRFVVSNVVAIILGVIAVGLVVGLVLTLLQINNKDAIQNAQTSVLSAARTYSIELSSYTYQHLTQDFATVESHSTASFKKSFAQSSNALKTTLVNFKASSTATVLASGVVSANPARAVILVFLSQTVSNSTQKQPTTDRSQIQMALVNQGGQWLIDSVTLL